MARRFIAGRRPGTADKAKNSDACILQNNPQLRNERRKKEILIRNEIPNSGFTVTEFILTGQTDLGMIVECRHTVAAKINEVSHERRFDHGILMLECVAFHD